MTAGKGAEELAGLRILVVEDEVLIAMFVEDLLLSRGCQVVGPASSVAEALDLMARERPNAAVLDVNLGAERVYPVADALKEARIPFVFVTGYGEAGLAGPYSGHPTIKKPLDHDRFGRDVAAGLQQAASRYGGG